MPPDTTTDFALLDSRLRTLLPEEYQYTYSTMQPTPMGSAGLKYDADGRVLWDEIWASFCHLALAGGPPHRGTLLEPASRTSIAEAPEQYIEVVHELCRGIGMVSGLAAEPADAPGWLHIDCPSTAMAGWFARAITIENVSAHVEGMTLHLPSGPHFRVEKEIKNVIVAVAKTCHYWLGHTSTAQHRAIGDLFRQMDGESPLLQPPFSSRSTHTLAFDRLRNKVTASIQSQTGLAATDTRYHGWLGVDCLRVPAALWLTRIMISSNTLCRREESSVFLPINPRTDPAGRRITTLFERAHHFAHAQGIL